MKVLGWITSFVIVMVFGTIFSGYALSILWGWFIVKTFNAPALTIPIAIGISMIVNYLTQSIDTKKNDDSATIILIKAIFVSILKPGFALLFGWVVVQFV